MVVQGDASAVNSGRYVKESYTQGGACDLTGQTRQTEVTRSKVPACQMTVSSAFTSLVHPAFANLLYINSQILVTAAKEGLLT